ncbi:unnamed protein product [Alternaria alternata]
MASYSPYNDKPTSKDSLKDEFDSSSTAYGSEVLANGTDEADSFLPYKKSFDQTNTRQSYAHSHGHHGDMKEDHGHGDAHHHATTGNTLESGETLNEKGLRVAPNGKLLECGSDKHWEAEANGCIFDVMTFEWTPPACHDPELLVDAIDPRSILAPNLASIFPWGRTADGLFDDPMEQDTAELGTLAYVWATEQWHRAHCMYNWRILVKAETRRLAGEQFMYTFRKSATSWKHIEHCNVLISDTTESKRNLTAIETFRGFTGCVRLDKPRAIDTPDHIDNSVQ